MLQAEGIESRCTEGEMTLVAVAATMVGEDEVNGKLL